ncbi:MAG: transposase, partial [Armatimonadota bacterium]|nr:transposase [Armatimonadota bacterium]
MHVTFEAKIKDPSIYPILDAIAALMNHVQRHLFVDMYIRRRPLSALKREYLVRFGITARQFNAV